LVVSYQSFGIAYSSKIGLMGLIGCPKTLVTNYQSMLHSIPEEQRPQRSVFSESVFQHFTHFCE